MTVETNPTEAVVTSFKLDNKLVLKTVNTVDTKFYEPQKAKLCSFPSDYTLARFSKLAYGNKKDYNQSESYQIPEGWELLATAEQFQEKRNGYFGVAFWHPKLCHIVVAHRGTEITNFGALNTDFWLTFNKNPRQSNSAVTFVHEIRKMMEKLQETYPNIHFQLSITGHSLGAWLAQLTTFTCKYLTADDEGFIKDPNFAHNIHAHAVVFESPGCGDILEKIVRKTIGRYSQSSYGNYRCLDMTVYVSQPNSINSVHHHVGTIYTINVNSHKIDKILELFNRKTGQIEKEIFVDFPSGKLRSLYLLKNFVYGSGKDSRCKTKTFNACEYSLNVFSESELHFAKNWTQLYKLKDKFQAILAFKYEYQIADFEVDDDNHTIISENLNSAIACIKHLNCGRDINYELIQTVSEHAGGFEILKTEVQLYQNSLASFGNFKFADLYNLQGFLQSESKILCIAVPNDLELDCELEASIFNNFFCSFGGQYAFLQWRTIQKLPPGVCDVLKDPGVHLVIVEYFDNLGEGHLGMVEFLKGIGNKKVVILTTVEISQNIAENFATSEFSERPGVAGAIGVEDLMPESQEELLSKKNLVVHGRKINLREINEKFSNTLTPNIIFQLITVRNDEEIQLTSTTAMVLNPAVSYKVFREIKIVEILDHIILHGKRCLYLVIHNRDEFYAIIPEHHQIELQGAENAELLTVQGDANFENFCHQNFEKIVYAFEVQEGKIYLTKVYNKDFYISRRLLHRHILDPSILSLQRTEGEDFPKIIFTNVESPKDLVKSVAHINSGMLKRENIVFTMPAKQASDKFFNWEKANLVDVDHGKFFLLQSGSTAFRVFRDFVTQDKDSSCDEFFLAEDRIENKLVIISGEPGLGKSALLSKLSTKLQKAHWVFQLTLKDYNLALKNLPRFLEIDTVVTFLCETCLKSTSELTKLILLHCLTGGTKLRVVILCDGFDDLHDQEVQESFTNLASFVKFKTQARMIITTRKYLCKELCYRLSAFETTFKAFEGDKEKIAFLSGFWYTQLSLTQNLGMCDLEAFAQKLLASARNNLGEDICRFIGAPLQMRIIAEVITPNIAQKFEDQIQFTDVLGLYQKYVKTRYDIYLQQYICKDTNIIWKWLTEDSIRKKYAMLAVMKLFNISLASVSEDDIKELNKVGLIQSEAFNYANSEFLHKSLQDFYVADLLAQWLETSFDLYPKYLQPEKFLAIQLFLKPEFKEIRVFLNSQLATVAVSDEQLQFCNEYFDATWELEKETLFNREADTAFHTAVRENLDCILEKYLFPSTQNLKVEYQAARNQNSETALFLALIKPREETLQLFLREFSALDESDAPIWSDSELEEILVATLFTNFINPGQLRKTTSYQNYNRGQTISRVIAKIEKFLPQIPVFLQAVDTGNLTKLDATIKNFDGEPLLRHYLLLVCDDKGQTPLHSAVINDNIKVVVRFLQLQCELNARDHHGMTALARACKEGRSEIAKVLLADGAETTSDYSNISPLTHAAKRGYFEIVRHLVNSKIDIEHQDIYKMTALTWAAKEGHLNVVQYLYEKCPKLVDTIDCNGMTPMYHAVKGMQPAVAKYLIEKGANVNIVDRYGVTPLIYSLNRMKSHASIVNSLLDRDADVNLGSTKIASPLKIAISKKAVGIVKKLLVNGAKCEFLNKDEQAYVDNVKKKFRI